MLGVPHLLELVIVLIVALIVFGPKRLPELGSSLGKGIREFKKATSELTDNFQSSTSLPGAHQTNPSAEQQAPPIHTAEYVQTPSHVDSTPPVDGGVHV